MGQRRTAANQRRFILENRREVIGSHVLAILLGLLALGLVIPPGAIIVYFVIGHTWFRKDLRLQRRARATACTLCWPTSSLLWFVPGVATLVTVLTLSELEVPSHWTEGAVAGVLLMSFGLTSWLVLRGWWRRWTKWSDGVLATPGDPFGAGTDLSIARNRLRLLLWGLLCPIAVPVIGIAIVWVAAPS